MKTFITILALVIHAICINAQEVPFVTFTGGTLFDGEDDLTHSIGVGQPLSDDLDLVLKYKHTHLYEEDIRNYDLHVKYDMFHSGNYSFGILCGGSLVDRDKFNNILQFEGITGIYNQIYMTNVVSLYIPVEMYISDRDFINRIYIGVGFNLNFIPNTNRNKRFF